MSDDLRDKFASDDEYDAFKKAYSDYKNKSGMFGQEGYKKELIEFQKLVYDSFVTNKKDFFQIPEKFTKIKNLPAYMFHLETSLPDSEILILILN